MRERLIELLKETFEYTRGTCIDFDEAAEINADHLLANGVIVPPCKVGDVVYITLHPYTFLPLKKAVEGEVMSLKIWEGGLSVTVLFDTNKINGCADYAEWTWGERLFFTREEAEKALKGGEG